MKGATEKKPSPRNYFSRREQWRLMLLVGALGLVIILMRETGNPANWAWFDALSSQDAVPDAPAEPPRRVSAPPVEPAGTIHSPGEKDSPIASKGDAKSSSVKPLEKTAAALDAVRDNMVVRPQEHDAWFELLAQLGATTESDLRRRSIGRVTWLQLYEQAPSYRGEIVTVAGTIRRAVRQPSPKNDVGVEATYQIWLFPDDRTDEPVVIHVLGLPQGFPKGAELAERAEVTGFFFKRWLYNSRGGMALSPLMLARDVRWTPPPPTEEPKRPVSSAAIFLALAGVLVVAAGFTIFVHRQTRRGVAPSAHGPRMRELPEKIDIPSPPPDETRSTIGPTNEPPPTQGDEP